MAHGGYQGWGPGNGLPQGGGDPYGPPPAGPHPHPYGPPQPGPYLPPPPQPYPPRPVRVRRSGCALFFVSPLIPVIRSARRRAEAIFNQPGAGRVADRLVTRVQLGRAIVGAAASLLLIYTYGADDGWSGVANDGVVKLILAPLLLIFTGPLVVLGFIRYAPAPQRRVLRSRLREPLKAVGWYVGILVGVGLVLAGSAVLLKQNYGTLVNGLVALGLLIGLVWLLPFLMFASAYAARYAFNTSNVHAALPAALTVVLVWELMLFSVALEGGMPHGPPAAQWCAVLGGPVSVTAVALWELHRMRTRHGVRIRQ
ncbi:hypothetical protein GCM10010449_13590 [Streptomyces rectiviolaceus]|uniref:Integral membrane protein n=1 Tax=Streptomyces rectiviolaceus TaxID=332591 RepID=A0ABP6M992_9ACTN